MRPLPVKVKEINPAAMIYLDYPLTGIVDRTIPVNGRNNHVTLIMEKVDYLIA